MDRRGFLRNILGSLAAIACPSIRAAKPLDPACDGKTFDDFLALVPRLEVAPPEPSKLPKDLNTAGGIIRYIYEQKLRDGTLTMAEARETLP